MCALLVLTYDLKSMSLTLRSATMLIRTQWAVKRSMLMLKINLNNTVTNKEFTKRIIVQDIIENIAKTSGVRLNM